MGKMKSKFEDYLIRDDFQESVFRAHYSERIGMYQEKYMEWFLKNFPLYKWKRMRVRPESVEFVIGLLCLLYREGKIQFTIRFPEDGSIDIQREEVGER